MVCSTYAWRLQIVVEDIELIATQVQKVQPSTETSSVSLAFFEKMGDSQKNVARVLVRQEVLGDLKTVKQDIPSAIMQIGLRNAQFVLIMLLLPFMGIGWRACFSRKLPMGDTQRIGQEEFGTKLLTAIAISVGWLYVLNPTGRAAGAVHDYVIFADPFNIESLPAYLLSRELPMTIVGFLGWYLNLLAYVTHKVATGDVRSVRVYSFLFGKLVFTYGLALALGPTLGEQARLTVFLIGFFPLTAWATIRDAGLKLMQGGQKQENLTVLPGASRWDVLRLEEEGIQGLSDLAAIDPRKLQSRLPGRMRPWVPFWVDVARLRAMLGAELYEKVKPYTISARTFMEVQSDPTIYAELQAAGVPRPETIAAELERTFVGLQDVDPSPRLAAKKLSRSLAVPASTSQSLELPIADTLSMRSQSTMASATTLSPDPKVSVETSSPPAPTDNPTSED